ncbi:pleckstrin homology domain containing A5, partial [Chelydra serpentina]
SYGISQGGRLFFINEEVKSTTWLHPHIGEAVITRHRSSGNGPALCRRESDRLPFIPPPPPQPPR